MGPSAGEPSPQREGEPATGRLLDNHEIDLVVLDESRDGAGYTALERALARPPGTTGGSAGPLDWLLL